MNLTRVVAFGAVAAGLAALVSATTSGTRHVETPAPVAPVTIEKSGAALQAEVERLHERLRPTAAPQEPARNLFQFSSASSRRAVPPAVSVPAVAPPIAPAVPPPPPFKLIGIAEDAGADGSPVRTAIISMSGQLFLVKEGEAVTGRYQVVKISGEAVELADATSADTPLRLALK